MRETAASTESRHASRRVVRVRETISGGGFVERLEPVARHVEALLDRLGARVRAGGVDGQPRSTVGVGHLDAREDELCPWEAVPGVVVGPLVVEGEAAEQAGTGSLGAGVYVARSEDPVDPLFDRGEPVPALGGEGRGGTARDHRRLVGRGPERSGSGHGVERSAEGRNRRSDRPTDETRACLVTSRDTHCTP